MSEEKMRLLIIRHGSPNYKDDTLTERGWREAELLAEKLSKMDIADFYVSPLGRAKDTASCTLKKLDRTAVECEWLREFWPQIDRPDKEDVKSIVWDWLPEDWKSEPRFYDRDKWYQVPVMKEAGVEEAYRQVQEGLDSLLATHGYVREGDLYRVERANHDKIVFFCHFGLSCVMLAHLMGVSPMPLWHHMVLIPTGIMSLVTEERRRGKASFRMDMFGNISHLTEMGEKPSAHARYREIFEDNGVFY